jgi:outer membrane lipoprotein
MFLLYLKYERYITMKKLYLLILINLFLFSCAPVLTRDLMQRGIYTTRLSEVKQNPVVNKGKLFILGGIVVKTTVKKEGSLVEAIFVPVDSMGYLKGYRAANERFLAIYRSKEILDPLIYREKREITLAGEFIEIRKGTIGEMEYDYPFFEIKEIYLWEEYKETGYYPPPYYPAPYYRYRYSPFYDYYPYYPWWYY